MWAKAAFVRGVLALAIVAASAQSRADLGSVGPQSPNQLPTPDTRFAPPDPTGGAYTSPSVFFIPAGALPQWNLRLTLLAEFQTPADVDANFRPGLGVELGMPARFTFAVGTNWVGGDVQAATSQKDFNLGLNPYAQVRFHAFGRTDGSGFHIGLALSYKFVGFEGDPGELEFAVSAQYRHKHFEVGLEGVVGQDFADVGGHDAEAHVYAVARIIPALALGAAGQMRLAIAPAAGDRALDVAGGALASLTIDRYQFGTLLGATTLGLEPGTVGALCQMFASARF